ncbi:hypothetical protein NW762_010490 [Fusarium torreyae]|uniref:Uncharacterized protein n=1 Tax=Fusarium torreyae TaxID=1237075 RepID=A0A9W8RT29_9HYPO|nr:hypothetical protein NW762_010490 [Fusarium torreyae]
MSVLSQEQASEVETIKKEEIPGMSTAIYVASTDHHKFLDEFGRKQYALGVEAGIAYAQKEMVAPLTARIAELEEQANNTSAYNLDLVAQASDKLRQGTSKLFYLAVSREDEVPEHTRPKLQDLGQEFQNLAFEFDDLVRGREGSQSTESSDGSWEGREGDAK